MWRASISCYSGKMVLYANNPAEYNALRNPGISSPLSADSAPPVYRCTYSREHIRRVLGQLTRSRLHKRQVGLKKRASSASREYSIRRFVRDVPEPDGRCTLYAA
jgi:hypothetical protein